MGPKYADLLERTLYNGFLAGISLDGERYIYANPLQVRDDHLAAGGDQDYARVPWFRCACCPPNVMRLIASLEHYVALSGPTELVLHQYVTGGYAAELAAGRVGVRVATDYPWRGEVEVTVAETVEPGVDPDGPRSALGGRCHPGRRRRARRRDARGRLVAPHPSLASSVTGSTLTLPVVPRLTTADPRVDAARGCVAVERGPLVYCVESADQPGQRLDDMIMALAGAASISERTADGLPERDRRPAPAGVAAAARRVVLVAVRRRVGTATGEAVAEQIELTAIPYFAWGNRGSGAMRIWLPTS